MKDYQNKRDNYYVLPEAVYRQVVWTLKDLNRMKERLKYLKMDAYMVGGFDMSKPVVSFKGLKVSDVTGNRAVSMTTLSKRIDAIESAFMEVPEKYREGVYNRLIFDVPYSNDFHINTWRKWQQKVMYEVAVNLEIL